MSDEFCVFNCDDDRQKSLNLWHVQCEEEF